jgi:tetratricopeptide (TPR) repeat protein
VLWIHLLLNIYSGGDARVAVRYGEQSLAIARELNLVEQTAFTLHDLYVALIYLGDFEHARAARVEARTLWQALGNQPMLAESVSGLALMEFLLGHFDQALSQAQEGFQISQAIGNLGGQGFSGYILGLIYLERGESARAFQSLHDAIPITEFGGLEGNGVSPLATLGLLYATLGDPDRARELVHSALDRRSTQLAYQRMWLHALLTRVELLDGHLEAAETAFREGAVVASVENYEHYLPPAAPDPYYAQVELYLARREYAPAVELMEALISQLRRAHAGFALPYAFYYKAQALRGQGRLDLAAAALSEAREQAEGMGSLRILWQIFAARSELERERGNQDDAREFASRAREVVEYIATHAPSGLAARFLEMPPVQALRASDGARPDLIQTRAGTV